MALRIHMTYAPHYDSLQPKCSPSHRSISGTVRVLCRECDIADTLTLIYRLSPTDGYL